MRNLSVYNSLSVVLIISLYLSGCDINQSNTKSSASYSDLPVADKPALIATIKDVEKPYDDTRASGSAIHAPTRSLFPVIFASKGGGAVYTVEKDGMVYVVHNGIAGSPVKAIGTVVLSSNGKRIAYAALIDDKWRMVVDGKPGEPFSTAKDPKFSPDGLHIAYQGMRGDLWHLIVDTTVNSGTTKRYRPHEFCGDNRSIVFIDNFDDVTKTGRLVVSDTNFNNERVIDSNVSDMYINSDRNVIAAISKNSAGKEQIIQFDIVKPNAIVKGAEYDKILHLVFADKGNTLAYIAERQGKIYAVFNGKEEHINAGMKPDIPVINQAGKSVGVMLHTDTGVYMYQLFRNSGRIGKEYDEAEGLVYSGDGTISAFAARKGKSWFIVTNANDGPPFDRVVSPKFSPDGKYLVYRARKDGKRFVVVADTAGKVLKTHPSYEQVFDVQFTADGKSVAYGVKDGNNLIWQVEKL